LVSQEIINNTLKDNIDLRTFDQLKEHDHRLIKKRTNPMMGFKSFRTAEQTITGIETIHMIKKGQVECNQSSPLFVVQLIHQLFGLIA
jgi:transposase, IS6 family